MAKQLNVNMAFTADVSQAKNQLKSLQTLLGEITSGNLGKNYTELGMTKDLAQAIAKANELNKILQKSTKENGDFDLKRFSLSLLEGKTDLKSFAKELDKLGPKGTEAFNQLAKTINSSTLQFDKARGVINEMWATMKNTARWQLSSSMLHDFIGGLQSAYSYAQKLNKSLTDIRIVSGESSESMAAFADRANKAAKELGSTTLKYSDAALIYFQQGLDDDAVKERTDATIKMANVTGEAVEQVSSYMTAIWNNFNKAGDESAEHFGDIMTLLGAETAASSEEIAGGLEKFASIGDTIGLSFDYAASAVTTIVDRTRESEDTVGNALKTIFSRMEGLKLGETLDDGTDLNKYSEAMQKVGINIKDTDGELKEMDQIIDEVGGKWSQLSRDQRVALAQTVAGTMQYTRFMALFDNFDFFEQMVDISENAEGTMEEQNKIYAESWEAATNRVKSAFEGMWQDLIDDKFFIEMTNGIADIVEGFGSIVDSAGGLKTILLSLSAIMLKTFSKNISESLTTLGTNLFFATKGGKKYANQQKSEAAHALAKSYADDDENFSSQIYIRNAELVDKLIAKEEELKKEKKEVNKEQLEYIELLKQSSLEAAEQAATARNAVEESYQGRKRKIASLSDELKIEASNTHYDTKQKKEIGNQSYAQLYNRNGTANVASNGKLIRNEGTEEGKKKNAYTTLNSKINRFQYDVSNLQNHYEAYGAYDTLKNSLNEEWSGKIKTEKDIKALKRVLDNFDEQLAGSSVKVENFSKKTQDAIADLNNDLNLDNAEVKIKEFSNTLEKEGIRVDKFRKQITNEAINSMSLDEGKTKRQIDSLSQESEKTGNLHGESIYRNSVAEELQDEIGVSIDQLEAQNYKLSDSAISAAESFGMIAASVEMSKSAFETFQDPASSAIDKLSTMGMAVPLVVSSFGSLSQTFKMFKNIDWDKIIKSVSIAGGLKETTAAAAQATGGIKGFGKALLGLAAANWPILALAAAIGTVVFIITKLDKASKNARNEFASLQQASENADKSLQEITSSIGELTDTMENINTKRQTLKDMQSGTAEWKKEVSGLNQEIIGSIQNYNKLNNKLPDRQKKTALENMKNQAEESDGLINPDDITTTDLIEGKDYYYDSQGVLNYTDTGQLKIETVGAIMVEEATIQANNAKMMEEAASGAAKKEELFGTIGNVINKSFGAEAVSSERYKFSDDFLEKELNVKNAKDVDVPENDSTTRHFLESTYDAFMAGIVDGQIQTSDFFDPSKADVLENYLKTTTDLTEKEIKEQVNIVQSNNELGQILKDHAQTLINSKEAMQTYGKENLMNDSTLDNHLKSNMEKKDYDKYGSTIKSWMGEDYVAMYGEKVNEYEKNKKNGMWLEKNVWGEGKDWTDYRQEFLNSDLGSSYTKNDEGKLVDTQGNEVSDEDLETIVTYYKMQKDSINAVLDSQDTYIDQLDKIKKAEEGFKKAKSIWDEQSDSLKDANKIMQVAIDKYDSFSEAVKKGDKSVKAAGKTFNDFANSIRSSMSDILGMDLDKSIFNGEFVQENFDTIQDAFSGDTEAINDLRDAYSIERMTQNADIAIKLNPELENEEQFKEIMQTRLNNLQNSLDDIKIGTTIDQEAFDNANAYMADYVGTAEGLLEELNDRGLDVELNDIVAEGAVVQGSAQGTDYKVVDGPELTNYTFTPKATTSVAGMVGGNIVDDETDDATPTIQGISGVWESSGSGKKVQNVAVEASDPIKLTDKNKDQTFTSFKFKETKASKAGVKRKPSKIPAPQTTTPPNTGGRGRNPGNRGGGGGSRGSSPSRRSSGTRARARDRKRPQSKYTRYKEIDTTMNRLSKATERQVKLEDQLYGKKKLEAMKQVNKNLQAELKAIQKKTKEARAYSLIDKNNLQKDLKEAEKTVADTIKKLNKDNKNKKSAKLKFTPITEFTFNEFGEITNYTKIMKGIDSQLKSLYKTYNKINSGDVQSTFYEKRIQPLEEAQSQIEDAVKQYDETRELMIELQEEWNEKYLEILDKNFENLSYQVELKLELTEGSKKLIDYFASKLESDAYKIGELFSYAFTDTYKNINESVAAYTDKNYQLPEGGDRLTYLENIQKQYERGTITQANYVEGLKQERDALLEQAQSYKELNDKMNQWYSDSLSKVQEELQRYTQSIESAGTAIEHLKNVINLSGEEKDYNKLIRYQNKLIGLAQEQYEISLKNYEARQAELKELDDAAKKATYNEEQQAQYEKQRQTIINQINDAGNEVLANYDTILQSAQSLLETQLEKASKEIDSFLSDTVGGFDELLDQMSRTSERQDEYLTKTNQIYEMNKMLRTLRQDMDKTDNKAAKQRMKNFESELNGLKEKGELSQLELDIAQARYEQLKAQIALEEAQNAKQTVRLRRDNEGNYGYVYTANEDQVSDAKQQVEDANNSLYNIYLEASNNYNQKIIDQTQSLLSKLQDIENSDLSKEEKQQLRETTIAQYKELISTSAKLAEIGQNGLKIDFGASGEDWMSNYTGPVQNILENLDGSLQEYLDKIDNANQQYQDIYEKYFETSNEIAENIYQNSQEVWKKLMGEDGESGLLAKLNKEMLDQVKNVSTWLEKLAVILAKMANLEGLLKELNNSIEDENTGSKDALATNYNYNQLLQNIAQNGYNSKITSAGFSDVSDTVKVFKDSKGAVASFKKVAEAMENSSDIQTYNEKIAKTLNEKRTEGAHGLIGYTSDGRLVYVTTSDGSSVSSSNITSLKDKLAKKMGGNSSLQNAKNLKLALNKYQAEKNKKKPSSSKLKTLRNDYNAQVDKTFSKEASRKKYKITTSTNKKSLEEIEKKINELIKTRRTDYWDKSNHEFVQFKTGGYTGDWGGQTGKLAMLHQKEIVLNKDDTKNLLASVDIIRGIVSSIDLQALSRQQNSNISAQNLTNFNGNNLQQDVRISAEFPNVRDRSEIEAAFDNLVNRAAQYANRRV